MLVFWIPMLLFDIPILLKQLEVSEQPELLE
jgi:hypothetical protein